MSENRKEINKKKINRKVEESKRILPAQLGHQTIPRPAHPLPTNPPVHPTETLTVPLLLPIPHSPLAPPPLGPNLDRERAVAVATATGAA